MVSCGCVVKDKDIILNIIDGTVFFSIMRTQDNHVKKYSLVQFTCKGKPPVHRAPLPCGSVAGACRKIDFHKPGGRDIGSGSNQ